MDLAEVRSGGEAFGQRLHHRLGANEELQLEQRWQRGTLFVVIRRLDITDARLTRALAPSI